MDTQPQIDALEVFTSWLAERERSTAAEFDQLLAAHANLASELEDLHRAWSDLVAAGDVSSDSHGARAIGEPIRLIPRDDKTARYRFEGEVARGGMGAILRVWDGDLRRHLAMKVALGVEQRSETKRLARFLEEARVAGRLDHPGIVPVHDLGLDETGRLCFTMKLVEGRDLKQIFELVHSDREGWNETRALGVILKVCEAMAYAHSKGVIHRDLKPSNVMVGAFGEVFVMDWGLARAMQQPDPHALGESDSHGDSSIVTREGVVLGTPAYMPPEQARGEIEQLSPRSDVYSVGAMLYHLLARRMPYQGTSTGADHQATLRRVLEGPPVPLQHANASVPPELIAICEKAMARDAPERYDDMRAFADDLRAFLEHRVVAAYETGAVAELRKWIARNRALASACAAAFVILAAGLTVSSALFIRAREESKRADARAADVLSLSAGRDLQELIERADALWPTRPEKIPEYAAWLRDARGLLAGRAADAHTGFKGRPGLADHRAKLVQLEARALPPVDGQASSPHIRFESGDDAWWHASLTALIESLEAFADEKTGLCSAGTNPKHGWGIERRLELARSLEERTLNGSDAARRWRDAIRSIADRGECPLYDGLEITPQLGLLPIGRNASSGLWEFAHVASGEPAVFGPAGEAEPTEEFGLVFVLIPGGSFWMGSQNADPDAENYDPSSVNTESPVHEVALDAYFLSKFEMSQAQWQRFTGENPSCYDLETNQGGNPTTLMHPVEQVSWSRATLVMARLDLRLPTEAQWERGARAGTRTPWWTGTEPESLAGAGNIADSFADRNNAPRTWKFATWLDDGYLAHAPIGTYRANPYGLHDVIGNVLEICGDGYGSYLLPVNPGDGARLGTDMRTRPLRGAGFHIGVIRARSTNRYDVTPDYSDFGFGVRPARALMP